MAYKEGVAETLMRVAKAKSKKEKVEILRKDHNIALENIIDLCYNPNIKFVLPEGVPPYKAQPKETDGQMVLFANLRKFSIWIENGPYPNLRQLKREQQFIQFLEMLDPDDAKLVCAIKDKKMPYKGITKKLFEEAWPALTSTWVEKKDNE